MVINKTTIQIFLAPIIWSAIFILFIILGHLILGPGKPSGAILGLIYAFMVAPFIGIAGIIYAIKIYKNQSNLKTYLSLSMNMSLILSGILVWLTWYGFI
ncbi:MAG: hypothetical protein ACN4GM_04245 [Gammaproteobacteria bacterium]